MRPADDQPTASHPLTVQEAASRLGVTVDAIRGRIKRGTLSSDRAEDGTVYVLLDHADQPSDQPEASHQPADDQLELVEVLQEQNDYLRQQLEVWQEEARRKDHIIAALAERIPAIEASQETTKEATESFVTPSESVQRGTGRDEAQSGLGRRSWWRRFFGVD